MPFYSQLILCIYAATNGVGGAQTDFVRNWFPGVGGEMILIFCCTIDCNLLRYFITKLVFGNFGEESKMTGCTQ